MIIITINHFQKTPDFNKKKLERKHFANHLLIFLPFNEQLIAAI